MRVIRYDRLALIAECSDRMRKVACVTQSFQLPSMQSSLQPGHKRKEKKASVAGYLSDSMSWVNV